jgi:hypothetical protein
LFLNVALDYAIKRVQVNQNVLKLKGTHQFLVYAGDVSILGGSVFSINTKVQALVVASKENGLQEFTDKTKYVVISRDQDAERSHSINNDNISFEDVKEFKYLGTTLTNQNSIQDEIKSRLNSGNVCYNSVQNLMSPSLQSQNLKIKI